MLAFGAKIDGMQPCDGALSVDRLLRYRDAVRIVHCLQPWARTVIRASAKTAEEGEVRRIRGRWPACFLHSSVGATVTRVCWLVG